MSTPTTYISQVTELPLAIACKWADEPQMQCGEQDFAVALRGQWNGGDEDIDPVWVPVCAAHDERWDTDYDTDEVLGTRYRLPRFPLAGAVPGAGQ